MTEKEAVLYMTDKYPEQFNGTARISADTVKRWIARGNLAELTESGIDRAVLLGHIPPKRGRPRKFSEGTRMDIIAACKEMSQDKVAKMFHCHPSYVSLVVRGLR